MRTESWSARSLRRWRTFWRLPGSRHFGALLAAVAGFLAASAWAFRWAYVHPETGAGLGWLGAVYAVFELLAFQPVMPLPEGPLAAFYFLLPLASVAVIGEGLVRLGRAISETEAWEAAMASTYEDHVIVCGMGQVGYRVTRWLLDLGECVVGVEPGESRFLGEVRGWRVPVVAADAQHAEVLESVGVRRARSIIPCTNDDFKNLSIALEARRINPAIKVVLRLFDERLAENVRRGFEIHTSFSVSGLSAPAFAAAATRAPVDYAFGYTGEDGTRTLLTICKFTVVEGSSLAGFTLQRLEEEFDVSVIMHRRGAAVDYHPKGDKPLAPGDGFVVSAQLAALQRIARLTPPTRELRRAPGPAGPASGPGGAASGPAG